MTSKQLSFRVDLEKIEALDEVAATLDRDRSYILNQAVDAYLDVYRWQTAHIERAIKEADAGGPFIAHEDVSAWMASLGTSNELPLPKATISKPARKNAGRRKI